MHALFFFHPVHPCEHEIILFYDKSLNNIKTGTKFCHSQLRDIIPAMLFNTLGLWLEPTKRVLCILGIKRETYFMILTNLNVFFNPETYKAKFITK